MSSTDTILLENLYRKRFDSTLEFRKEMWGVLCEEFFQKEIGYPDRIVEFASGYCEFINHIQAKQKIAVDINADALRNAAPGIDRICANTTELSQIPTASVDVVFCSNYFEHLTREEIRKTVLTACRILKKSGKFLILQPNIRYCARDYWMFFDHITPVDDRGLTELLNSSGFSVKKCLPQFLPYSTQGRLPNSILLLKIYLKIPLLWKLFGSQAYLVAEKL